MNKNFADFSPSASLTTGDFLVGYNQGATSEFRTTLVSLADALRSYYAAFPNGPAPTPTPTSTVSFPTLGDISGGDADQNGDLPCPPLPEPPPPQPPVRVEGTGRKDPHFELSFSSAGSEPVFVAEWDDNDINQMNEMLTLQFSRPGSDLWVFHKNKYFKSGSAEGCVIEYVRVWHNGMNLIYRASDLPTGLFTVSFGQTDLILSVERDSFGERMDLSFSFNSVSNINSLGGGYGVVLKRALLNSPDFYWSSGSAPGVDGFGLAGAPFGISRSDLEMMTSIKPAPASYDNEPDPMVTPEFTATPTPTPTVTPTLNDGAPTVTPTVRFPGNRFIPEIGNVTDPVIREAFQRSNMQCSSSIADLASFVSLTVVGSRDRTSNTSWDPVPQSRLPITLDPSGVRPIAESSFFDPFGFSAVR